MFSSEIIAQPRYAPYSFRSTTFSFHYRIVEWWKEYPGPHIPAPQEIGSAPGDFDVKTRSKEILALTKMNWNSADGIGRFPITLTFAKRVGMLMTEMGNVEEPNPLYRFYFYM
jgi:argonaute-like protein implicated in RNA metabolism and viral defense